MNLEKAVLHHANKSGTPVATLLDAGFVVWEVRLILNGFTRYLDMGELMNFVSNSIRDERKKDNEHTKNF